MKRFAEFSPCRTWRYSLRRLGLAHSARCLLAVLLNPSKADEERDDPTTTFMMNIARREECGAYEAVNAFAFCDTYPAGLYESAYADPPVDIVGPGNDEAITVAKARADLIIVAWGNHGNYQGRAARVLELLKGRSLFCFGYNQNGTPRFPRAIPSDVELIRYNPMLQYEKRVDD